MESSAIEVVHLSKYYKDESIIANDDLTLKFNRGEITCIAGENGAGKSTLMKIIFGMDRPSKGDIFVNGQKEEITHPLIAQALGIGMVHQKFKLFDNLSICENVSLGVELKKHLFFLDKVKTLRKVQELIDSHHIQLSADTKIKDLSTGEKQLVEILKMLYREAEILIFDEPTAVLTEQETQQLFETMRELKAQNKCVIVITHKVQEILDIADVVSIMRKGKLVGTYKRSQLNGKSLSDLIMGEEVKSIKVEKKNINYSILRPVLSFKDVSIYRENQEKPLLHNINFVSHQGEILGFCGVSGNGMGILEAVLGGMLPISSGQIILDGKEITNLTSDKLRANGLAFVPADRYQYGSAANATLAENLIINHRNRLKEMNEFSKPLIDKYNINGQPSQMMKTLSGGNIQKAIVAREIENMKDYIILSNPTWGMDLAATAFIHSQILELKKKGASIILLSQNVDEILLLSDTINVMTNGQISKTFTSFKDVDKLLIGEYMLGRKS
jgi:simple sugar transport system ATP-binding protein